MGLFDSLLGLNTNAALSKATSAANALTGQTQTNNAGILNNTTSNAGTALTDGTNLALGSLASGYAGAKNDVTNYSGQAQNALTSGVNQAVGTVQGSNGLFQPYATSGTAASGVLSNALGLNGSDGSAAAKAAFTASPGYTYQVDQASDAAARKAASLGMAASGNTLSAITTLGSNLADQEYGSWLDRLSSLSSQGLSASSSMSGNNAMAAGYQYGGAGTLASLLNGTGTTLGSYDTGLGTGSAGLQSALGTNIGTLNTNLGSSLTGNNWTGTNAINAANLNNATEQDRTTSANNGIFKSLLGTVTGIKL